MLMKIYAVRSVHIVTCNAIESAQRKKETEQRHPKLHLTREKKRKKGKNNI